MPGIFWFCSKVKCNVTRYPERYQKKSSFLMALLNKDITWKNKTLTSMFSVERLGGFKNAEEKESCKVMKRNTTIKHIMCLSLLFIDDISKAVSLSTVG